ncbi:XRE family transcriptional regulator [Bacillus massiliglaciei]|uniref:XRE family transcriptional regulator n=1 Tax=Bacillus massiliglaciei TaxID=1816693 RepID=UPI000DA5FE86|nr:XRE family transcriptional regulator [Bacillus massiliglaciei]
MIGEKIKELREKRGYSLSKLAQMADVSKSYLSQIERGLKNNPSVQFLEKVSVPLKISAEDLLAADKQHGCLSKELDAEWKRLIEQAVKAGMKKEDFREYRNYLQYQNWRKDQLGK